MDNMARSIGRAAARQGLGLTDTQQSLLKAVINCLIAAGENPNNPKELAKDAWVLGKWSGYHEPEIKTISVQDHITMRDKEMTLAINSIGPDAAAVGALLRDLLSGLI